MTNWTSSIPNTGDESYCDMQPTETAGEYECSRCGATHTDARIAEKEAEGMTEAEAVAHATVGCNGHKIVRVP